MPPLTWLGMLLLLDGAGRCFTALDRLPMYLELFRQPPVPEPDLYPRVRLLAIAWGIFPFIAGLAGLFTGLMALRRRVGQPLLLSVSAGICAGVGLDGLHWNGDMDLKLIAGVGWKEGVAARFEGALDLARNFLALGGSTFCFFALPWRARLGGPSEAQPPRHPSLFWVSFLSGLSLSLVVAEGARRISASMGKW